jgi:hypothetical protein
MMGGLGGSTLPLLVCGSFPAAAGGENGLFPFNVATEVACAGTLGRGQHTPAASETPPATPQCVRHDVVQESGWVDGVGKSASMAQWWVLVLR